MKSIISNNKRCYRCGSFSNLQIHHCLAGAYRKKADEDGLVVWLCLDCHTGSRGVHNTKEGMKWWREYLMPLAQSKYLESHTEEEWMSRYGRNFL